jgi:hypothetical protein
VLLEALDHASFLEEKWWRGGGRSLKQEQTFKSWEFYGSSFTVHLLSSRGTRM